LQYFSTNSLAATTKKQRPLFCQNFFDIFELKAVHTLVPNPPGGKPILLKFGLGPNFVCSLSKYRTKSDS